MHTSLYLHLGPLSLITVKVSKLLSSDVENLRRLEKQHRALRNIPIIERNNNLNRLHICLKIILFINRETEKSSVLHLLNYLIDKE